MNNANEFWKGVFKIMDIIRKIRRKQEQGGWPKFIEEIEINGLRGWKGEKVTFQFPVTAICGENGSGKSTVLKAAACAYRAEEEEKYKTYNPGDFFRNTIWDDIRNVVIKYKIREGNTEYSIRKKTERWRGLDKRRKRRVFFLDITRTQPIDSLVGYARMAKISVKETSTKNLNSVFLKKLNYILGKSYKEARFATTNVDEEKMVGILARDFGNYSQFHQGAGEDATLDLMLLLQDIPDYSLVIIDEVEASLHPKAQRRLIRFLMEFALERQVQVILSTHSPYILEELPPEARILLLRGVDGINVIPGVTPEFALSTIDEKNYPELFLFVEDKESSILLRELIVHSDHELIHRVKILPVGPENTVSFLGKIASNGKLPFKSLSVLDGDKDNEYCIKLPGNLAPEKQVFSDIKKKNLFDKLEQFFGVPQNDIRNIFEDAILTLDHHQWCSYIGNALSLDPDTVWRYLVKIWVSNCIDKGLIDSFVEKIRSNIGVTSTVN